MGWPVSKLVEEVGQDRNAHDVLASSLTKAFLLQSFKHGMVDLH